MISQNKKDISRIEQLFLLIMRLLTGVILLVPILTSMGLSIVLSQPNAGLASIMVWYLVPISFLLVLILATFCKGNRFSAAILILLGPILYIIELPILLPHAFKSSNLDLVSVSSIVLVLTLYVLHFFVAIKLHKKVSSRR